MSDEREQEMLDLMRECSMTMRRCENKLNEIWAEWTRTHGLRGGVSKPLETGPDGKFLPNQPKAETPRVVRRVVKR